MIDETTYLNNSEDAKISMDKASENPKVVESGGRFKVIYPFITFLTIGTIQLIGWNSFLNSIFLIYGSIYGNTADISHIQTITATYATINFIMTCLCIVYTSHFVKPSVTYIGLIITGLTAVLYFIGTIFKYSAAYYIFHIVGAFMGFSSALIGCSAFGYANYFPSNYGGAMSAGLGVSGVVTFIIWIIGRYVIFESDAEGIRGATGLLNGFSLFLCICGLILMLKFFSEPWVKDIVKRKKNEQLIESYRANEVVAEKTESILETFKAVWVISLLFFYTMFITLFCFPGLAPFHFTLTDTHKEILIGIFQIGDLIGRYTPNILSISLLNKPALIVTCFLRTIFAILCLLTYGLAYETAVLNSLWFQTIIMLLLSITNGWIITCCFIRIPDFVQSDVAKARVGSIALLAILLGITVGQWANYGVVELWIVERPLL